MRYLPHTEDEIREMLRVIGAPTVDALFNAIPDDRRFRGALALEPTLDEATLMGHLTDLARKNEGARYVSFLGAGMYDHHIPPAVDQLLLRSEFYTAYTPYQPEISQGTLQAIFEFQTIVCQLFGMEIANASMYDGASAAAEAVLMARRLRGTTHAVISAGLHPHYIETINAYLKGADDTPNIRIVPVDASGRTDLVALENAVRPDTACVVVGYPNFFGVVEDLRAVREISAKKGALAVAATGEVYALALLEAPGTLGFDIAVGEGQSLAVPPQFGGPGVGLFACSQKHLRQMPGRLCGETIDANGKRGFVLTLSTREQHIRRERATSNICTNHGLIALAMLMRTAMLGKSGFDAAARICLSRAEYLKKRLVETGKVTLPYAAATFDEFVVRRTRGTAAELLTALEKEGILGGVDLGTFDPSWKSDVLIAVTEKRTPAELDRLVDAIARLG